MSKDKGKDDGSLLGSSTTPEPINRPTDHSGQPTAPATAAEAGSATHLNAYRQELEDLRGETVNKVNEAFDKAGEALDAAQAKLQ